MGDKPTFHCTNCGKELAMRQNKKHDCDKKKRIAQNHAEEKHSQQNKK